jgi:hypothetical protein
LRLVGAALPSRLGYALTCHLTPKLGGRRAAWIAERVCAAVALRCDESLAQPAGERFVAHLACDDLDEITALLWPARVRRRAMSVEGATLLPTSRRALFVSLHFSGGARVFDALSARGYRPGLIAAPPVAGSDRYSRVLSKVRAAHWRRDLPSAVYFVGPDVPRAQARTPALHLREHGALVVLLDVPGRLSGRDTARVRFLDGLMDVPVGMIRLATRAGVPIVPFDARLEDSVRIVRFHEPILTADPDDAAQRTVAVLETVVRQSPWEWHGWLGL